MALVRNLARRIAEIAASEEQALIHKRWRDVNALRKPDRFPVYCRPIGASLEIIPEDSLVCTDPWLRGVERSFRQTLHKHDIGDDTPIDPWFPVGVRFDCDPPNVWGLDIRRHQPGVDGGAWAFDPPLKTEADLEWLRFPRFSLNERKTHEALSQAEDLLGDILSVGLTCESPVGANIATPASELRGLAELLMGVAAEPELVHRLMSHILEGTLRAMNQVEASGMLTPNNRGAMFCSDPIGDPRPDGRYTFRNLWGHANNQELDLISPAMFEEFVLSYQMRALERYGLSVYGCCENLTHKIDAVLRIPNLRIFVCSAWTDLDRVIEKVGDRYCIMWRQKASDVVFPDDVSGIKRHLDEGVNKLKGCYAQVVLRELQTLSGHPDRLHTWARLAKDAAERYC